MGGLAGALECFRVATFAAQFERFKVFVPRALWDFGPRFDPESETIQVFETDVAIAYWLDQMISQGRGKPATKFRSAASLTKDKTAEFVTQPFRFFRSSAARKRSAG